MNDQVSLLNSSANHVDAVNSWDLDFLKLYLVEKVPTVPIPAEGLREYRRFIALTLLTEGSCVPSKIIDEIWHAHILHSKDYISFSRSLGMDYIHHCPSQSDEKEVLKVEYSQTLDRYRSIFEVTPNPIFWPTSENAICQDDPPGKDCRNCQGDGIS